ncbi:MAG: SusC/RagA family TonB-linked outer membrane protein [Odoribacter sp.]
MKKIQEIVFPAREKLSKILLVVKLKIFLILFSCLQLNAAVHSQNNVKISLELEDVSLEQVIWEIQKKTDFVFMYGTKDVETVRNLTVKESNKTVNEVLWKCLNNTGLKYEISGNAIIIKRGEMQPVGVGIKGKVTDKNAMPLPGVTVVLKGSNVGVATDVDGNYVLQFGNNITNPVLVFSFIGMQTKEVAVCERDVVNVKMEEVVNELKGVVVTGIFRRTKELSTGASITVSGEELKQIGNQNVLQSLRTLDPSFKIIESNVNGSNPNALPEIELRGTNGIANLDANYKGNPNQPLFILDGFETSLQKVIDLDPNRVESISILKDASAAALYGSRSANGVVVIETKAPEPGNIKVSYTGDYAVTTPDLTDYNLLNADEKLQLQLEAGHFNIKDGQINSALKEKLDYYNRLLGNVKSGVNTYWLSQPLRTAFEHRHTLYVEGGDQAIRYGVNFSAKLAPGVMKGSGRNTYGGGVVLSYRTKDLIVKNDMQVEYTDGDNSPYGDFSQYAKLNPYFKPEVAGKAEALFDVNIPSDFKKGVYRNPLHDAMLNNVDQTASFDFRNNFSIEWKIVNSLTLMGRFSISKQSTDEEVFISAKHSKYVDMGDPIRDPDNYLLRGEFKKGDGNEFGVSGDINLRLAQQFGKHMLYAVTGFNMSETNVRSTVIKAQGFPNDKMTDISFAKQYYQDTRPEAAYDIKRLAGFLLTANYAYDSKYLLDLSLKIDGSSNFGSNNKFAPVWSVGAGWNIHKERLLADWGQVSLLKLRASYGVQASQNFAPFQSMQMYVYDTNHQYNGIVSTAIKGLGNSDLKWQKTKTWNIGFEMGLWSDRLVAIIDVYNRLTSSLLSPVTIAPSTGFPSYTANIGETENKGVDASIRYTVIRRPENRISWSVNGSLSHNVNKITNINNAMKKHNDKALVANTNTSTPPKLYMEGNSMNAIYTANSLGIDPATGKEMFLNKDGQITYAWDAGNLIVAGDERPDLEGIIGTTFIYKDLTFSASFRYQIGAQKYNQTIVDRVENANLYDNVDRRVYEKRWMNAGDITFYKDVKNTEITRATSRFVQDENVFSCESVSLSYDLRVQKVLKAIGAERIRFTGYLNELFRLSTIRQERGISYPFANRFALSVNVTF